MPLWKWERASDRFEECMGAYDGWKPGERKA